LLKRKEKHDDRRMEHKEDKNATYVFYFSVKICILPQATAASLSTTHQAA
jgi:hypothetical protein